MKRDDLAKSNALKKKREKKRQSNKSRKINQVKARKNGFSR